MTIEPFTPRVSTPIVTITLGDLADAEPVLTRLLDVTLTPQRAYNLAKLARLVADETAHFKAQRDALIRQYGEPVPDGPAGMMRVTEEHTSTFLTHLQELRAVTATLAVTPLRLAELPDVSGAELLRLGLLVTD